MFERGQFSFDLIFTLLVFVVFLQFLIYYSGELGDSQNKMNVYNQQRSIAAKIKLAYNSCRIADLNSDVTSTSLIRLKIPIINEASSSGRSEKCAITLVGGNLSISHPWSNGLAPEVYTEFLPEAQTYALTTNCGDIVEIRC